MRTLIAIPLSESLTTSVEANVDRIKKLAPAARWVREDQHHLSLTFVGEVATNTAAQIDRLLAQVAARHRAFELKLTGTGTFGPLDCPKVLWADLRGDLDALRALQRHIVDGLRELGVPPDYEVFEPHVTLARARNPRGDETLCRCDEALKRTTFGDLAVDTIGHFESETGPSGMTFRPLSLHRLGGFTQS